MRLIAISLCILGSLILVFRSHYYGQWMNIAAFLCALVPLLVWLDPLLNSMARKLTDKYSWIRFWEKVFAMPFTICWIGLLFYLHTLYINTLMAAKTTVVDARIERKEIRKSKGGSYKYFIYYYVYNNAQYYNEMSAENGGYQLGDYFELKVSTFDPTVTELVQ